MTAWNTSTLSDTAFLRAGKTPQTSRTEELAFNLILVLALAGVAWNLANSAQLASGLQSIVSFVRQWVG